MDEDEKKGKDFMRMSKIDENSMRMRKKDEDSMRMRMVLKTILIFIF